MVSRVGTNLVKHFNARQKMKVTPLCNQLHFLILPVIVLHQSGMNAIRFVQAIRHISAMASLGAKTPDAKAGEAPAPGEQPSQAASGETHQHTATVALTPPVAPLEREENAHIVSSTVEN